MSYSIEMPVHASPAQLRVAAEFFSKLADVCEEESAAFEEDMRAKSVTVNVVNAAQSVTREEATDLRQAITEMVKSSGARLDEGVFDATMRNVEAPIVYVGPGEDEAPAPSAVFGGAAAPAPLPEPSATAAPVPAPSSTIPEPSSAPAAAVPGPVITDAAAAIGLPSPSGPVLDKEGLPWDHRIHAESKATNQDGTWRKKRGVTDEEFARVKAEMKAMMSGTPVPGPSAPHAAAPVPVPTQTTSQPHPAPSATAPAATPPAPTGDNGYGAMMLWLNGPMVSQPQKITMADLSSTIANCAPIFGIEPPAGGFNISTIKLAPAQLIAMIRAELGTLAASRGWVEEVAS